MSLYTDYQTEIDTRKEQGLNPKPIDNGTLVAELMGVIFSWQMNFFIIL